MIIFEIIRSVVEEWKKMIRVQIYGMSNNFEKGNIEEAIWILYRIRDNMANIDTTGMYIVEEGAL